ncbi:MAG: terminase family protein [Litoreibacter sp.]|nr:terminase family protein [Litoreibacter sp.]
MVKFVESLPDHLVQALPYIFEFWALDHQLPPEGDWRTWVILGGRGAGKTRAGAEWVRAQVEGNMPLDEGRARRVALVGETFDQVRDVMVFGDSGIMACSPDDRKPEWQATRRRLVWPNGAIAECHSASSPEGLRGPQFDAAWVDELAKWQKGQQAWDMLQFGLRLGSHPQQVVTTTPRNVSVLKRILETGSTVTTSAATEANAAYLADNFLEEIRNRYGGTRLGRQELDGELLEDVEGALWTSAMLEGLRCSDLPDFDRIVVAVDPAVTSGKAADACGIVVAGAIYGQDRKDWRCIILEDATIRGASPQTWAERVARIADQYAADRVVAEVNQGGELVGTMIRQADAMVPFKALHAAVRKSVRAEPVAALYEQGRILHYGDLSLLEDEMCQMTPKGFAGSGSPDRLDAMVWAVTELMISGGPPPQPRMRSV